MNTLRRLGLQAAVLLLLALVATMAVGKVVFDPPARSGGSESSSGGGDGGGGSASAPGSDRTEATGPGTDASDPGGSAHRRRADGVVEFSSGGRGGSPAARGETPPIASGGRFGGVLVRVRFQPTPRLKTFLDQLDASFDRDESLASLDKFVKRHGERLAAEERLGPFTTFLEKLTEGAPTLEAVTETMHRHGPAGRDALDAIFDLKRAEYGATLEKYLVEKQRGRSVESKIYRYEQKIQLVDELRGEINKSFRFE